MSQSDENDSNMPNHTVPNQPDSKAMGQHPGTRQHSASQDYASSYGGPPHTQAFTAQPEQATGYGYGEPSGYAGPSGYQAPGYGQGMPAPGYGPGPGQVPNPGYQAPYGYPQYGYPMQRGPVRPGGATASAVLMFIQAALTLISTFYVLFFASLAGSASAAGVSEADSYETEFTIIGILQLISVGLLIFGGVQLLGGNANGRVLTIVACGVQLAFVIYWMVRIGSLPDFDVDGSTFFFVVPLMYAVLPLVALPLALGRPVSEYIAAKQMARTGLS
ncbi:MAG: hypothetical protein H0T99_09390 [Geodermatophilaceae bacterium]|nr:hypothetical protein [Geodermatophilaceae bacterium]